jgi:ATP-dependent helicase/nuclease subunit A
MKKTKWTKPQNLAIETVDRGVLVTASAGAGKTAVLSERCIRRICDVKRPVDVDQLLVLTFTEMAAEEMKGRIAEKLYAICQEQPDNRHLRKQLVRLDAAWIGTIHSFCKRILTEHFYLAGLDPRFGILDPDQQKLIRAKAMSTAIENAWRDETLSPAMRALFNGRQLRGGRNTFPDVLLGLTEFLDSVPDRNAFYQSAAQLAGDKLVQLHLDYLRRQLTLCRDIAMYAQQLDHTIAKGQYLTDYTEGILQTLNQCLDVAQRKDIAAIADIIVGWEFSRMPSVGKKLELDKSQTERIKELVESAREKIKSLKNLVLFQPELLQWILPAAGRQTQTLIALLRRFDEDYTKTKRSLNVLDFADLEHQTLAMFNAQPAVAEKLRQRFAYVFVDEYQDINDTQQRLLQAVSRPDNVFVVGDVKQSIYAFRQSRPEIFLEQLSAATDDVKSSDIALRVDMNDNFRSRREILGFVNRVFARIMTQSMTGMDYMNRAELIAGLDYPPLAGTTPASRKAVELYILDEKIDDDDAGENGDNEGDFSGQEPVPQNFVTAVQRQAAFIARRIRQMVDGAEFEVMDKKTQTMRPVQYNDIVVLMRALSYRAAEYVELLRLAGIPVSSQSQCGYFAATEVTDFLSLLKVLDNPLQDIELAAVLRSVLFSFTDSDLAMMRWFARQGKEKCTTFFEVFSHYANQGPNESLRLKAADAMSAIENWRVEARRKPLSELIWEIFEKHGVPAFVSALPNGPQRRANLLKLHGRAVQFESFAGVSAGRNLAAFVDFLEKLLEEEFDWAPAQPDNGAENAVRVMSVHKSKGLEFPVVFLAELNRSFRKTQSSSACRINSQMLALELPDLPHGVRIPSPALQLIRLTENQSAMAEEMRILYVAMTRAKDRLVLTASEKCDRCQQWLARLPDAVALPDWILTDAQSHLDWILAALAGSDAVSEAIVSDTPRPFEEDLFIVSRAGKNELDALTGEIRNQKRHREKIYRPVEAKCSDSSIHNVFGQIRSQLGWSYPHGALTTLNAKFSVSTLTHRDDEFARYADFTIPDQESFAVKREDPLNLGAAVHLVFEHLPLTSQLSESIIQQTVADLTRQKRISIAIAEQIDVKAVASFFQTDIGSQILAHPEKILREWSFTRALAVSELGIDYPGESVVVQGIVDLILPTAKGMIVIDFKTDKIGRQKVAERAKLYQSQLGLYSRAIQTTLRVPVAGAYLYFLHPQTLFSVAPDNILLKTSYLSDAPA